MRCRKGGGRWCKVGWRWEGKELEEVREYKYLGYIRKGNGEQDAQVKDRVKKGAAILGKVWSLGKRMFGGDWGRRIRLFDRLVWSVISSGVEIWG
ncbi:hypothetical protein X777_05470 [Ooceraea biroi]|uniref:Uncharacterized protein n=1 Tax=Ooceraea biroi TaxID=2015173 RepID=A0A026WGZ0_OOCBI|nr:hypothetical protein X777_05470 [Ooceraea biroi]